MMGTMVDACNAVIIANQEQLIIWAYHDKLTDYVVSLCIDVLVLKPEQVKYMFPKIIRIRPQICNGMRLFTLKYSSVIKILRDIGYYQRFH